MAATLPPKSKKVSEADIEAVINKGGKTVKEFSNNNLETPKHINIRLTGDLINKINILREKRPKKPGSPKAGISLHDWIVEAVLEKLNK